MTISVGRKTVMKLPHEYVMDLIVKHLVRIDDNLFHDFSDDEGECL